MDEEYRNDRHGVPDNISVMSIEGAYRLLLNGNVAECHRSLDSARKAASEMGRARAASKSAPLRISVETAECEEVYVLVIIGDCDDLTSGCGAAR
jgi:hypothetical protein